MNHQSRPVKCLDPTQARISAATVCCQQQTTNTSRINVSDVHAHARVLVSHLTLSHLLHRRRRCVVAVILQLPWLLSVMF